MTIRRDLAELEDAGQLHRVHGGATIRRAPAYNSRASVQATEKAARAALRLFSLPSHTPRKPDFTHGDFSAHLNYALFSTNSGVSTSSGLSFIGNNPRTRI